jgi:hypothetical protein
MTPYQSYPCQKIAEQIITVGQRPFTELYSSMAAQTAPSSDILAARRLLRVFILNYELVDRCSSGPVTGKQWSHVRGCL